MNPQAHAIRVGFARGGTQIKHSLRSPEDWSYYLFWGGGGLLYLYLNRNETVEGTTLLLPALALPGVLAALVIFIAVISPALDMVTEREDGTLLRAKALPRGLTSYVTAQVVVQVVAILPMVLVLLLPASLMIDGVMQRGVPGWFAALGILFLSIAAVLPFGLIIGSLANKPTQVLTWGMLPIGALVATSGAFVPLATMWGWVQGLAQVFPLYWAGHAMRWAFLPEDAAVFELGEQWRVLEAVGVMGAWAVVGLVVAPIALRRMARRESGSAVQERMHDRMQRIA